MCNDMIVFIVDFSHGQYLFCFVIIQLVPNERTLHIPSFETNAFLCYLSYNYFYMPIIPLYPMALNFMILAN